MGSPDESFEYILLRKNSVFVYKIPPRESDGYRAERWSKPIWEGRLQVAGKGENCLIRLLELSSDSLFATCIVSKDIDAVVERTVDSSRYFVIRLDDGRGRHAFVGIGFSNRNDAFDFIASVNDFYNQPTEPLSIEPESIKNLSLAEAQPIKIRLKNLPERSTKQTRDSCSPTSLTSGPLAPLAPPPNESSKSRFRQKGSTTEENLFPVKPSRTPASSLSEVEEQKFRPPSPSKRGKSGRKNEVTGTGDRDNYEAFEAAFGTGPTPKVQANEASSPSVNDRTNETAAKVDKGTQKQVEQFAPSVEGHGHFRWDVFSDEALANWSLAKDAAHPAAQQPHHHQVVHNNPFGNQIFHET